MESKIAKLNNHFIICGYGRVAETIAGALKEHQANFVVIEKDPQNADRARQAGFLVIQDDATKDVNWSSNERLPQVAPTRLPNRMPQLAWKRISGSRGLG